MNGRGRIALVAIIVLMIFLAGSALNELDKRKEADARRDKAIAELIKTQDGVVAKLTEVFAKTLQAEEAARAAGTAPQITVDKIVQGLKGFVDPKLIEQAIEKAKVSIRTVPGPQGPQGPPGSAAPATTSPTPNPTTTSTSTTTTTKNTVPPSSTTTTTRRCLVTVPGVAKIGC